MTDQLRACKALWSQHPASFESPTVRFRDITQVPHPLMSETRALLEGTRAELRFIHLNHSNPAIVDGQDVAHEGMTFSL